MITVRSFFPRSVALPTVALKSEQLFEVYNALFPARHNWFNLGGVLSVQTGDLKAIRKTGDDASECLREVLDFRLKQLPPLTWEDIVAALRTKVIAEQTLAKTIEDDKCLLGNPGGGQDGQSDGKAATSVLVSPCV